ncbi:hypothetical protein PoB_000850800 [Plakobranchus ocellatus]|uniref:Uncharacterized protein n=1 Tax=Plakobranchus ocellatus TaxID=259542 RepID=A0AAV3YHW3_9GAST|nr:hypothetical protein PoB_000850800 [Plakobranchus ocellatus]
MLRLQIDDIHNPTKHAKILCSLAPYRDILNVQLIRITTMLEVSSKCTSCAGPEMRMSAEITGLISLCSTRLAHRNRQKKTPLKNHDISSIPW